MWGVWLIVLVLEELKTGFGNGLIFKRGKHKILCLSLSEKKEKTIKNWM